jgi:hypothetical protein
MVALKMLRLLLFQGKKSINQIVKFELLLQVQDHENWDRSIRDPWQMKKLLKYIVKSGFS